MSVTHNYTYITLVFDVILFTIDRDNAIPGKSRYPWHQYNLIYDEEKRQGGRSERGL